MFTRLLVGLDGSPGADAALETAIGLARRFRTTIVRDLLIAGAHGGRRHAWSFGSHAEKLLEASSVPVIIHR